MDCKNVKNDTMGRNGKDVTDAVVCNDTFDCENHVASEEEYFQMLSKVDKERFLKLTPEEKRMEITESRQMKQDEMMRKQNAGLSQLADRIASHSFQG